MVFGYTIPKFNSVRQLVTFFYRVAEEFLEQRKLRPGKGLRRGRFQLILGCHDRELPYSGLASHFVVFPMEFLIDSIREPGMAEGSDLAGATPLMRTKRLYVS